MRKGALALLGYRSGSAASRLVPRWALAGVANAIGSGVAALATDRRRVVAGNLRRVLGPETDGPTLERAVRRAFCYYIYYWMESFRLGSTRPGEFALHMSSEGFEHVLAATETGRGAILALPHLGSWDYAGAWMASIGYPMTVVVEPLDPPEVFRWFMELRQSLGLTVVPMGAGAAPAVIRTLRAGRVVGLLSDRDLAGNGVEVEFFGERTTLPAGPATIALRTGAALLPTGVYTMPRGDHTSIVRPPIPLDRTGSLREDVERITRILARELECLVRRAPSQWHVFQPNWPGGENGAVGDPA